MGAPSGPVVFVHGYPSGPGRDLFERFAASLGLGGRAVVIDAADAEAGGFALAGRLVHPLATLGERPAAVVGYVAGAPAVHLACEALPEPLRPALYVDVAAPWGGSRQLARWWPGELARSLLPGSPFLEAARRAAERHAGSTLRAVGDRDALAGDSTRAERDLLVAGAGHHSVLESQALRVVIEACVGGKVGAAIPSSKVVERVCG